ncbi:hypothetical protein RFN25_07465 [Mesorhizobium abyssinicae]|uniref:hypothetical protein n=1 Tax=Mesorhizobium abyssinicae TaxID=1209958 RepID=UPI002A2432AD|nr:hypothetical protein [Mesorhizobium abyssinicae]MDX8433271.1 hypothetical protein [Mesorhizobium abyssinicae]
MLTKRRSPLYLPGGVWTRLSSTGHNPNFFMHPDSDRLEVSFPQQRRYRQDFDDRLPEDEIAYLLDDWDFDALIDEQRRPMMNGSTR